MTSTVPETLHSGAGLTWKSGLRILASTLVLSGIAGCDRVPDSLNEVTTVGDQEAAGSFLYNREYLFVSQDSAAPLMVPFAFQARDNGTQLERVTRGWLARGATWDRFLDQSSRTSRAGGVWRVVPDASLAVLAGGPTELEALQFQRAERRLRLDLGRATTGWNQDGDTRFRVLDGSIAVGGERHSGPVLELLRVDRTAPDGWPPGRDFDSIFLTTRDSVRLFVTSGQSEESAGFAWLQRGSTERTVDGVELQWPETRPFEDARRDIPQRWTFRAAGGQLSGNIEATGFDAVLGPERAGRRAVEIRYSVEGWVEISGERRDVVGVIRHTQQ